MHNILVISMFSILGFFVTGIFIFLAIKKINAFGKSSMNPIMLYSGKVALFACWFLAVFQAAKLKFIYIENNEALSWIGTVLIIIGTFFMTVSFYNLGNSIRMGLPSEDTKLKTSGLYKISRNPIYIGFIFINIGSLFYFPVWYNFILAMIATIVHHFIILEEEKFLQSTFKSDWENYCKKVRRYL